MLSHFGSKCIIRPLQIWYKLCRWYNRKISDFFAWLGETVGHHPLATIAISLFVLFVSASGISFIQTENRTDKLYTPQNSEGVKNLEKAADYGFFRPFRLAEVIISQKDGNVITEACFREALNLHNSVTAIPGYQEVCLPNIQTDPQATLSSCQREEPLWIFKYASNFTNLLPTLNSYYQTNIDLFQRVFGKVLKNNSNGEIISAQALRMIYHIKGVRPDDEIPQKILDWEKEFVEKLENFDSLECGSLVFNSEHSVSEAILASVQSDVKLVALTYIIMIGFSCLALAKFRNPLTGHGLLATSSVLCIVFGILTGFGISMFSQTPFISICWVLPFLITGVGIDDMFIMVDQLDRTHPDQKVPNRLSIVMKTVGPTITMTTITDLLAFAVGTSSKFPSIVFFCTYAALSITFAFLFLVTIFVAFMSYDCERMNAGRRDMVPCLKAPPPHPEAPRWDEPLPQTSNKIMEIWGRFLMKTPTKVVVVILSICLLAVGSCGATLVSEEFQIRLLAKDDSAFIRFQDTLLEYFTNDLQVDLIIETGVNYSDPITQMKIDSLTQIIEDNKFYRPAVRSWFAELKKWHRTENIENTLLGSLNLFLESEPQFKKDIQFADDNSTIKASRLYCLLKSTSSSVEQRDALTTLRDDLKHKTTLPVFANAYLFLLFEMYISTLPEVVRNLALAATAITIATSLFLVNPLATLTVLLGFISLVFELLGLMYVWDVPLNSISMINLVMAIGFAVDYSAHVAHSFVFSTESNPEKRVVNALKTVGASVIMGGCSTFLGIVVTAFASSEIFRIFFRMFTGIVVLGLLHGLCFLPVWLSILCRREIIMRPDVNDMENNTDALSDRKGIGVIRSGRNRYLSNTNSAITSSMANVINICETNSNATKNLSIPGDVQPHILAPITRQENPVEEKMENSVFGENSCDGCVTYDTKL